VLSGARVEDEGLYTVMHSYWAKALQQAVDRESTGAAGEGRDR
jgi:hypothetical protein